MAVRDLLVAVVGVDFNDVAFFLLVGGGFVVEDGVPVGEEFVFGAPFCCYTALLIEFTEVVEIVDVVAVALGGRVNMCSG
jgi:hypothetical protein